MEGKENPKPKILAQLLGPVCSPLPSFLSLSSSFLHWAGLLPVCPGPISLSHPSLPSPFLSSRAGLSYFYKIILVPFPLSLSLMRHAQVTWSPASPIPSPSSSSSFHDKPRNRRARTGQRSEHASSSPSTLFTFLHECNWSYLFFSLLIHSTIIHHHQWMVTRLKMWSVEGAEVDFLGSF